MKIPYLDFDNEDLLYDQETFDPYDCDVLFLNCGTESDVDPQKLEQFVNNGGCLYASDLTDYIVNEAFNNILDTTQLGEVCDMDARVVDKELSDVIDI